jgi:hypothetical protein
MLFGQGEVTAGATLTVTVGTKGALSTGGASSTIAGFTPRASGSSATMTASGGAGGVVGTSGSTPASDVSFENFGDGFYIQASAGGINAGSGAGGGAVGTNGGSDSGTGNATPRPYLSQIFECGDGNSGGVGAGGENFSTGGHGKIIIYY